MAVDNRLNSTILVELGRKEVELLKGIINYLQRIEGKLSPNTAKGRE